jgi:hypothetical protein
MFVLHTRVSSTTEVDGEKITNRRLKTLSVTIQRAIPFENRLSPTVIMVSSRVTPIPPAGMNSQKRFRHIGEEYLSFQVEREEGGSQLA